MELRHNGWFLFHTQDVLGHQNTKGDVATLMAGREVGPASQRCESLLLARRREPARLTVAELGGLAQHLGQYREPQPP